MILFAAVDLQQGEVVQLVGGRAADAPVRWADPVAVALNWVAQGFRALHVVDLDAARGRGSNWTLVEALIRAVPVPVQVGGGIRDDTAIRRLLESGAQRVIIGTRALEDAAWRRAAARRHPGQLIVAADVQGDHIVTRGWTHSLPLQLNHALADLNADPLGAVLITDVGREGRMTGVDMALFSAACRTSAHPVYAAGGIRDSADLQTLQAAGAAGAVLGMALYTGAIAVTTLPGAAS